MNQGPYIRPMSKTTWYMRNGRYKVYVLRELTSVIVAIYCFLTIYALSILAMGLEERWVDFLSSQESIAMMIFHTLAFPYFLLYQTFPWFKLAPKAMPVQIGESRLPDSYIVVGHYVAWFIASIFIFWLAGVI